MDRYSDEVLSVETKTRTNKNQELYTDVYMNNVCVDIDNLKNVMKEDDYQPTEKLKLVKENKLTDVTYTDKEYNINILIEEAIKNQKQDNIKRSIDTKLDDMEIDSLIESINENKESRENQSDDLLADLMPRSDNTLVIPPLASPILEGGYDDKVSDNTLSTDKEVDKQKETLEEINSQDEEKDKDKEINDETINDNQTSTNYEKQENEEEFTDKVEDDKKEIEKDEEVEDEEVENILGESGHGKIVLIVFLVLIVIFVVIGILLYKHII